MTFKNIIKTTLDNIDEMGKSLERYKLPNIEKKYSKYPYRYLKIEFVDKKPLYKENCRLR